jgi:branched-chain amino acid transport system substrate-binding protein
MRRLFAVVVVAAVAVGIVAGAPSWAQKGAIKVGMLVPQTGPLAANGKDMINGFELFFEEQHYKLAGRDIKFIV